MKSWEEKAEKQGYGVIKPELYNEYFMVKVGNHWTKDRYCNETNEPLTTDFRRAICYRDKFPSEFFPRRYDMKKAKRDVEMFGGKLVKVTVMVEEVEVMPDVLNQLGE